jgi:hypothetical protein
MSNFGIKISKEGYDVKTAEPYELAFSSKWSLFKRYIEGTVNFTILNGNQYGVGVVNHSLGRKPSMVAYWSPNTGEWRLVGDPAYMSFNSNIRCIGASYNTSVQFAGIRNHTSGNQTINIRYIIYLDPGE